MATPAWSKRKRPDADSLCRFDRKGRPGILRGAFHFAVHSIGLSASLALLGAAAAGGAGGLAAGAPAGASAGAWPGASFKANLGRGRGSGGGGGSVGSTTAKRVGGGATVLGAFTAWELGMLRLGMLGLEMLALG